MFRLDAAIIPATPYHINDGLSSISKVARRVCSHLRSKRERDKRTGKTGVLDNGITNGTWSAAVASPARIPSRLAGKVIAIIGCASPRFASFRCSLPVPRARSRTRKPGGRSSDVRDARRASSVRPHHLGSDRQSRCSSS